MLQIVLAPCSPFSVTGDLMRESAALARQYGVFCILISLRRRMKKLFVWKNLAIVRWHICSLSIGSAMMSGLHIPCISMRMKFRSMQIKAVGCSLPEFQYAPCFWDCSDFGISKSGGKGWPWGDGSASNDSSNLLLKPGWECF